MITTRSGKKNILTERKLQGFHYKYHKTMRTIKFRARCEKESRYAGEWVEGSLVQCADGTALIVSAQSDNCQSIYHVDPETVCQFTGVEDDYGNELYEHDYVKTSNSLATQEILWSEKDAAFILKYEDDDGVFTQIGDISFKFLMKVGNALMYHDPE